MTTLGIVVGNRGFFPETLIADGRNEILQALAQLGIDAVILDETSAKKGAVETWRDAQECAALFRAHRQRIDGIVVSLPNFGDEKGIADAIKLSELQVPILVQAYPDDLDQFNIERRRDAFCGKISVCNNLRQYGYPYTLTSLHTVHPTHESFAADLDSFVRVCRVVKGIKKARLGAVGARPNAFNTVRYSEKILQAQGISVSTIDLSEVFAASNKLDAGDSRVQDRIRAIQAYVETAGIPLPALAKMAKLAIVLDDWMSENDLDATAVQCWESMQLNYGVNACTVMSMMSEKLMPSACEVDVSGAISMYALQLASGTPSALVDWNNNYANDPDKCVLFHCGNWARSFFGSTRANGGTPAVKMANAEILATTLGTENTYGTLAGRVPTGPLSYARVSTDDVSGLVHCYVGQGAFIADSLRTFGSRAVAEVPELQALLRYICKNGFEHHVAMSASRSAGVLHEALSTYMGWDVYHHCASQN